MKKMKAAGYKQAGALGDRVKGLKERVKSRQGAPRAKELIKKVVAAKMKGAEDSSAKGGRHRKAGSKMLLKQGGKRGRKMTKVTI